jgi:hypothetical protein
MNKMYLKKLSIIILCLCTQSMTAQVVGDSLRITLHDQSSITGKLIEKKGDDWLVETKSAGNISFKQQNMVRFSVLTPLKKKSFKCFEPLNYFAAHTAIPLQKGEGYYQAAQLIFHSVNYGLTKYCSVSGGFEVINFLTKEVAGQGLLPVFEYISPRLSYPIYSNWYFSTGILLGRDVNGNLFNGVTNALTVFYATTTFGNRNTNLSFSYGQRLEKIPKVDLFSSFFPPRERQNMNFLNLAGKVRLSENWTILSEGWSWTSVFSSRTTFAGIGVRYSQPRLNIGLSVLKAFFDGGTGSFPLVTIGIPFKLL